MKSNVRPWLYGPNWQGTRCEAQTRKGTPCQRPGNKINGRCKLHGGRSTGPRTQDGLTRLTASKTTHGRTTKVERAKAKHRAEVGRQLRAELKEIEQWAVDRGSFDQELARPIQVNPEPLPNGVTVPNPNDSNQKIKGGRP